MSVDLQTNSIQLSTGQYGQRGIKKGFNFDAYYSKKLTIQRNIEKNAQKSFLQKWQFTNCCLLTLESNSLKPIEMFNTIKKALLSYDINENQIYSISQLASSKNWQIQFKDSQSFNAAMGKTITIRDELFTLIDANNRSSRPLENKPVTLTVFLRIHWLPHGFKDKVVNFLKSEVPFLNIVDAKVEKWDSGKSSIENGIISVKVNYDISDNQRFLDIIGLHKIEGQAALFSISGAPPRCLYCKEFGHMRKDCPKIKTKCSLCGRIGHESFECTLANRITSDNNQLASNSNDDDDDVDDNIEIDESNGNLATEISIVSVTPAATTSNTVVTTYPEQTIEVKKESLHLPLNAVNIINSVASNAGDFQAPTSVPCSSLQRSSSVDSNSTKTVGANTVAPNIKPKNQAKTKSLKRPTSIKAEIWSKLNDDQKKEAIEKAAQDELNATNVAAHATFKRSSSVKRQSSSTSINDENKKAATSGADLQPNQV